jgi:hypothetical protein
MSDPGGQRPVGPHGTRLAGSLNAPASPDATPIPEDGDGGERSARLPDELPPESLRSAPVITGPLEPGGLPARGAGPASPTPLPDDLRPSAYAALPLRESILLAARQHRTTVHDVGDLALRLTQLRPGAADVSLVTRQLAVSLALALAVVLIGTSSIAAGTLRLVLGVLAATVATMLAVFGALRAVSRLGSRRGAQQLPGSALLWVGGLVFVVGAATPALTWRVSEATRPLIQQHLPRPPAPTVAPTTPPTPTASGADAHVKRGTFASVGRGVLYVPTAFSSPDGHFDLVIHYHGNTQLIEASVDAVQLNALVLIVNYGEGSDRYSSPLKVRGAFDQLLGSIETVAAERLHLEHPRIRRLALSGWSAGYAAIGQILGSRSQLDRVDAVLLMDGIHGSFLPGSSTEIHPLTLKPFLEYARRAVAGDKLMFITHSAIETDGYSSTTQTTDALLAALGLQRRPVTDPAASPAPVTLDVAVRAFPTGERRWLTVESEVHEGSFTLLGCHGKGKGDHIAHLAQMSKTVLPALVDRWRAPSETR